MIIKYNFHKKGFSLGRVLNKGLWHLGNGLLSHYLFFQQITGGNVTHFIHCEDLGLVALIDMNGDLYYYEFDPLG